MTHWAFLGAGAMAGAMVRGLLAAGATKPEAIVCIGGNDPTAAHLSRDTGVSVAGSYEDLLHEADVLIVACKPQTLAELPAALAALAAGKLVVSILAGKRIASLAKVFPHARNVVRVMPNTPGQIGAGISGWCASAAPTSADRGMLLELLQALGKVVEVEEAMMDAVTAVSGSGPAYVFEFAAALREAGIAAGLPVGTATLLAQQTILGAAQLLVEGDASAETLRDRVTSPNGTTFAALQVFQKRDFRGVVAEAVAAASRRSKELSAEG